MAIKGEEERSRPWASDEYVKLNGYNLVYTTYQEGKRHHVDLVAMPGGEMVYVENFLAKYPNARMPRRLRR